MFKKLMVPVVALSWLAACAANEPASPAPPPAPAPTVSFMTFFDWDSSKLNDQAVRTIHEAAVAYQGKGANARVSATGYTDTTGNPDYNMRLAQRRVDAVKAGLVKEGVPAAAITTNSRGETDLLVNTGDDVKDQRNRRVQIIIQ
jgi:outer membrane protein OmpA-like peptidoglycan-associated protein